MILYKDIYDFDIVLMNEVIKKYGSDNNAWELFKTFYKDPDGYPINKNGYEIKNGIECTVDAIISINRIYEHEGFNKKFIEEFTIYRETPIIFFPREKGGINTSRYSIFGDRIDHTLFDLKQYFEGKYCKLISSYKLPKTRLWLESFNNFDEMVKYMKIDGIFTNENNEIYNLEKNNDEIIHSYCDTYSKHWKENYYKNVKLKIKNFKEKLYLR